MEKHLGTVQYLSFGHEGINRYKDEECKNNASVQHTHTQTHTRTQWLSNMVISFLFAGRVTLKFLSGMYDGKKIYFGYLL